MKKLCTRAANFRRITPFVAAGIVAGAILTAYFNRERDERLVQLAEEMDDSRCPYHLRNTFRASAAQRAILFNPDNTLNDSGLSAVRLGCFIYPHTDAAQGIVRPAPVKKPPSGPTRANGPVS